MSDTIFFNMLLNIGLLVLIAMLFTKLPVVRRLILGEISSVYSKVALILIFGGMSIISTYTGIQTQGAIVNTRVIGVLTAGLFGGPFVGLGAALIGSLHRCFIIGGFTGVACGISTLMEGVIGSIFSSRLKAGRLSGAGIFLLTALTEAGQMVIILLVAKPFHAALELVQTIAAPMIVMNSFGMLMFCGTFRVVFLEEEQQYTEIIRLTMGIVEKCLSHLRKGLYSVKDMEAVTEIIYCSIPCAAVFIADTEKILASKVSGQYEGPPDKELLPRMILNEIAASPAGEAEGERADSGSSALAWPSGKEYRIVSAPLQKNGCPIGELILLVKKRHLQSLYYVELVSELARLFSTQLELSELDYQRLLLRKAEFRALKSQVNPHFLYNALNTVSYICRYDSERARELLLILSQYYRQTLENDRYMQPFSDELKHTLCYLELEEARFEEKLDISLDIEEGLDFIVPSFILQPLVENAVKYGADKEGIRKVSIYAHVYPCGKDTGSKIKVAVCDSGPGVPKEISEALYYGRQMDRVGLQNVHKRLQAVYGSENGLRIQSTDEGSQIWFLADKESERAKEEDE